MKKATHLYLCAALENKSVLAFNRPIDPHKYSRLPNVQHVIKGWFVHALRKIRVADSECFEPFIFTWIAFNAWAETVTDLERDLEWVVAISRYEQLARTFKSRIEIPDDAMTVAARRFHQYWPIPKVQDLRRRTNNRPHSQSSSDRLHFFLENGIPFEPFCSGRHLPGSPIPLDWEHFIRATYRVRCNLFHGEKSLSDLDDRIIVASAFRALALFLDSQKIFGEEYQ